MSQRNRRLAALKWLKTPETPLSNKRVRTVGKVVHTVQKFGGEYLVRAGEYKVIDGEWKYPRTVVIKFPTYEKALEWYDSKEYKPVKPIRLANSVANGIIIKGV